MKIDGREIASEIKEQLIDQIFSLRQKKIIPHLCVILVGSDPSSLIYVGQKEKTAKLLGIKVSLYKLESHTDKSQLVKLVQKLNRDQSVHGIIIQRPLPFPVDKTELNSLVQPTKDVDGFHPKSPYLPPIGKAIIKILEWVYRTGFKTYETAGGSNGKRDHFEAEDIKNELINWLEKRKILIIGRGETAGIPIAKSFDKLRLPFRVAHSKTTSLKSLFLNSNIIISCVGKPNVVRRNMINEKSIVIGVGLHSENGKLLPDYNQEQIGKIAAYWTPVPGGVGPVNVACLFENLVAASYKLYK